VNIERCILMADDEANDVYLLQRAFRDAKITNPLLAVQDGQEVIDYLKGAGKFSGRAQYPLPSVLILDLKMPRKSGMDVLAWIRNTDGFRCLPTIVFSSSAHPSDVEKAYTLGANAFVVKPTGIEQRAEFARMVKGFWLGLIEPPPVGEPVVRRTKRK
jgi:CheY-like chemotaxis protein